MLISESILVVRLLCFLGWGYLGHNGDIISVLFSWFLQLINPFFCNKIRLDYSKGSHFYLFLTILGTNLGWLPDFWGSNSYFVNSKRLVSCRSSLSPNMLYLTFQKCSRQFLASGFELSKISRLCFPQLYKRQAHSAQQLSAAKWSCG